MRRSGRRAARGHRGGAAGWLALALLLAPGGAHAHGSLAVGDFYSGMLDPLLHFETLLPALALALWAGQQGMPHAWRLPLLYLAAALAGAAAGVLGVELTSAGTLVRASMLVLGLLVAVRLPLPAVLAGAAVLLLGLATGESHGFDPEGRIERPVLFVSGLASGLALIVYHVARNVLLHRALWFQTGVRVLGSWIAATGLLVLVLEWAPR